MKRKYRSKKIRIVGAVVFLALMNDLRKRKEKLLDLRLDTTIDRDIYESKNRELSEQLKKLQEEQEQYLRAWDELENYHLQEDALDKLFFTLCPENSDMSDILLKVAALNDFYSTNIFSVYPVAKHILSLNIDDRLMTGDVALVSDIQKVTINGVEKNFYSFATKYCSHHRPLDYPICDSYVEKVLCYFRDRDKFASFKTPELKDYTKFKGTLIDFRSFYGLDQYNLEEIDKYMWQLGKEYFPKNYRKKKVQEEQ